MTKNAPFVTPFTVANATSGPTVSVTGHMASMLIAFKVIVNRSTLVEPNLSQAKPAPNRPTAVQALKAATIPAPVEADSPIDWANSGRKYGGTKSANVPTAPFSRSALCFQGEHGSPETIFRGSRLALTKVK